MTISVNKDIDNKIQWYLISGIMTSDVTKSFPPPTLGQVTDQIGQSVTEIPEKLPTRQK